MAWTGGPGGFASNTSKTAGTTLALAVPAFTWAVNDYVVVYIACDNTGTADGDNSEISSVTDTQSNAYTKLKEFTNAQGSAASGATAALYGSKLTAALGSTDTITITFANSVTAKAAAAECYSLGGAGNIVTVAGSATLATDGADPGAITISGLASQEYLFVACVA